MVDETPQSQKKVKNCGHRKGTDEEEYQKIRIQHSNDTREVNVWGRNTATSRQDVHDQMWDAFPNVQQFRIPRVVGERLDLSANAKLVYGVLLCFPQGAVLYRWEIAGFCGLSTYAASLALGDLERAGLVKIQKQWRRKDRKAIGPPRQGPSKFFPVQPPNRFKEKEPLKFLSNDISNFEELIRGNINEIEP